MSKSRNNRRHHLDEGFGGRKSVNSQTKIVNPKDIQKQHRWDWRDEIDKEDDMAETYGHDEV